MWDVVSRSVDVISKNPIVMVPQLITLVLTLLGDFSTSASLVAARLLLSVLTVVVGLIVAGAYPSMVKAVLDGATISVTDALGKAYRRFWALLIAAILVALLVVVGLIALIVPGLIFVTWYAYTVPAIMLEDKGALEGMSASRAFGRDKKWSTFLLFVVFAVAGLLIDLIGSVFSIASPHLGQVVSAILDVPLGAFISVVFAYAYITHGPSSSVVGEGPSGVSSAPSLSQPPPEPVVTSPSSRYCESCGAPLQGNAKFCGVCGKPVAT